MGEDATRRLGSIARAFDKVKAAMKRRSRSLQSPPATPLATGQSVRAEGSAARSEEDVTAVKVTEPTTDLEERIPEIPIKETTSRQLRTITTELSPGSVYVDDCIEVDTSDEDQLDEPLLPISPDRARFTAEKARDLFAQHGLNYERRSKRPQQEPPNKIRRVEKPIRLRIHWTCHLCNVQFGHDRICVGCGHPKCRDCSRHPPKRIRQLVDETRLEVQRVEEQRQEAVAATTVVETAQTPTPAVTAIAAVTAPVAVPSSSTLRRKMLTGTLELDDGDETDRGEFSTSNYELAVYTRPRAGVRTVLKPKSQVARRICHKCNTHILPAARNDCTNCGHNKCAKCPRYPPKAPKLDDDSEDEVPMVRAVERVYRKPRQRVRYTCEHCATLFVERDQCRECGHHRCSNCHREPPKRVPTQHNAEILQAVANRLATYSSSGGAGGGGYGQSVTAAATE